MAYAFANGLANCSNSAHGTVTRSQSDSACPPRNPRRRDCRLDGRSRTAKKEETRTHRYVGLEFVALAVVALLQSKYALVDAEIIVLAVHHVHARLRTIIEDVQGDEPEEL